MPGSVTGAEAIKAIIAAFPEVVRDAALDAVQMTASEMVRDAKNRVPVRTGTLRDYIAFSPPSPKTLRAKFGIARATTRINGIKVSGRIIVGRNGSARTSEGAISLSPSHYAHLVEYGHGGPHRAPAHPFMRPAFEGQVGPYEDRMKKAMNAVPDQLANVGSSFL